MGLQGVRLNPLWSKIISFSWGISKICITLANDPPPLPLFFHLDPLFRNPGSAPGLQVKAMLWAIHVAALFLSLGVYLVQDV